MLFCGLDARLLGAHITESPNHIPLLDCLWGSRCQPVVLTFLIRSSSLHFLLWEVSVFYGLDWFKDGALMRVWSMEEVVL